MTAEAKTPDRWPGHRFALWFFLCLVIAGIAAFFMTMRHASLPPEASGKMLVVFDPAMSRDDVFTAITRADGQPLRPTWIASVWVVNGETPGLAGRLQKLGALAAYKELPFSPQLAGCFAFVDAKAVELFKLRI